MKKEGQATATVGGAPEPGRIEKSLSTKVPQPNASSRTDDSGAVDSRFLSFISFVSYPSGLGDAAFHGPAGRFVRVVEPHTEADPAAILLQFLVIAGNCLGRGPYFQHENDRHHANLFTVIVGDSSKGRKGVALSQALRLWKEVDPDWADNCVQSGLSSGEGLIYAVRDPPPFSTGPGPADPGVDDKRLLVVEQEFASVLKRMDGHGNSLSPVLRQAWDTGSLRVLTKNNPTRATDAHTSLIGHITRYEINRYLNRTEQGNGFANRLLWVCARRSKLLPDGGNLKPQQLDPVKQQLHRALSTARTRGSYVLARDPDAAQLWRDVYPGLSAEQPGLLGAVTSRAEAQVMRLALVYALLDAAEAISKVHLEAALEIWRYCCESARFIFGSALGDPLADEVLRLLRQSGGMTRTELSNSFGRNKGAADLGRVLSMLEENGLGRMERDEGKGSGRPAERWIALKPQDDERNERNEEKPTPPDSEQQ